MPAYIIVQIHVHDPVAYKEYTTQVPATLTPFGGKFLVRGGSVQTLEGDWKPERFVILEFPGIEQAKQWWSSPDYRAIVEVRYRNATSQMILVEGYAPLE